MQGADSLPTHVRMPTSMPTSSSVNSMVNIGGNVGDRDPPSGPGGGQGEVSDGFVGERMRVGAWKTTRKAMAMAKEGWKEQFVEKVKLVGIPVPVAQCNALQKRLKKHLYDRPKRRSVVRGTEPEDVRLLLLHERYAEETEMPKEVVEVMEELGIEGRTYEDVLDYEHCSTEQVLQKLFPGVQELPTSFETVGHIAHLNLKEGFREHKEIIGQVFLDKNQPHIRTVVNKVGNIEDEFRIFPMEVLAGENNTVTEVRQHGSRFKLDYAKVYWNSRLETEHKRLVEHFREGDVVCDMMAGIGPFAVPAARKGCTVYANDLNPASTHYLRLNSKINKVQDKIHAFNMDAREFVRLLVHPTAERMQEAKARQGMHEDGEHLRGVLSDTPESGVSLDHVVMNLPASAVEFLDVFQDVVDGLELLAGQQQMPRIHCYLFAKSHETEDDIRKRAEGFLGARIKDATLHLVRNVAPNKNMFCLSFSLPRATCFCAGEVKRQRCE
eukprot:scaffold950_cov360-Pavlova_lutheri.AAC.30